MGGYTTEQAWELAMLSFSIKCQIGLLIDRQGRPFMVIVGDARAIFIPDLGRFRTGTTRLRGLRLLHTHLDGQGLSEEDLTDMLFLRLDSVAALTLRAAGDPHRLHIAHLLPPNAEEKPYDVLPSLPWDKVDFDFSAKAEALEGELAREDASLKQEEGRERAVLVHVSEFPRARQEASLAELEELADTAGLACVDRIMQRVPKVNPKYLIGKGKLTDLEVKALQGNAGVILFDRELSPAQMRNLAEVTERKILDRTQLILDIFAQHATSRAGKLQVEMAQLQYMMPRLVGQNRALSRLMGGIGGRGPGETKLEVDRRRVRERIDRIKGDLKQLRRQRGLVRARRAKGGVPIVSLVGYTNAGKSTLLNTLTQSDILAEDKLFATLDPTSRRIRFPQDREIIITDTVGFIRELPKELQEAFRATLEELESADLLIQVADAGHPEVENQIDAVDRILMDMELHEIPRVLVLNKWDSLDEDARHIMHNIYPDAIPACARERPSLAPLVEKILEKLG